MNTDYNNAGLGKRFFAHILDSQIYWTFFLILVAVIVYALNSVSQEPLYIVGIASIVLCLLLASALLKLLYQAYFTSRYGGGLGKLLAGIKVTDKETSELISFKTAFYRYFLGYSFSSILFGLGFWRIIKNKDNYAWHDDLFKTKVTQSSGTAKGFVVFALLTLMHIYFAGFLVVKAGDLINDLGLDQYSSMLENMESGYLEEPSDDNMYFPLEEPSEMAPEEFDQNMEEQFNLFENIEEFERPIEDNQVESFEI